jgi:hypothetical protein
MSAAVVLLAHGVGEGFAPCRREVAVDVPVPIIGVPILLCAFEPTAGCCWPVPVVLAAPAAPALSAAVAAVVLAAPGVGLAVGEGDGEGEVELDVGLVDGVGEPDVEVGELVFEFGGLEKRPFGFWVFWHPGGVAELRGWLDEGPGNPEPSGPPLPPGPGLYPPGLNAREFVEGPAGKRAEPFSPTYVPAATTKAARPRAASGRSHLSARPRSDTESGPNRCQTWRIPCASSGPAVCSAARARRKKSVQAASSQAMASGRGRRSLA